MCPPFSAKHTSTPFSRSTRATMAPPSTSAPSLASGRPMASPIERVESMSGS
jgi:hypothetical protein